MSPETNAPIKKGSVPEAMAVFIVVLVATFLILSSYQAYVAEMSKEPYPLTTGDYMEYSFQGTLANLTVGGDFIFYFTERSDRAEEYFVVTICPRAPSDQMRPFDGKPLIMSEYFTYDKRNLTAIGGVILDALATYVGMNVSDRPDSGFGTFIAFENPDVGFYLGWAAHYSIDYHGASVDQWITNGTGVPLRIDYSDDHGSNLQITFMQASEEWANQAVFYAH